MKKTIKIIAKVFIWLMILPEVAQGWAKYFSNPYILLIIGVTGAYGLIVVLTWIFDPNE